MDYRPASFPLTPAQESPYLPFRDADFIGSLFLGDQFLPGLLQGHQPVSLSLGHKQMSFVHPPGSTLSIGHFYFAQIGHYYFAASIPGPLRRLPQTSKMYVPSGSQSGPKTRPAWSFSEGELL